MGLRLARVPLLQRVEPRDLRELATFACGGFSVWETEVDEVVRALAATPRLPGGEGLLAARDADSGMFVGLVHWRPYTIRKGYLRGVLIVVIALTADARGAHVRTVEDRVADRLLTEADAQLVAEWPGAREPHRWATVHRENEPSQALFARGGYHEETALGADDYAWLMRDGTWE
ncbi:MAG: hypothetical protein ACJ762_06195 [Solirubrobacteraceae bacterium]